MASFAHESAEYRVQDGTVQKRGIGERRWQTVALGPLAKEYAVGEGPWPWLREQGISRPSPSGYTSEAETKRTTVAVKLRLPEQDATDLEKLATDASTSKSSLVSTWIRAAKRK